MSEALETRTAMQVPEMAQPTAETFVNVFNADGVLMRKALGKIGIDPGNILDDGLWGDGDPFIDDGDWQ